ncbi:hypothetical protein BD289DRAFT_252741 [Coniella lustricola]|uniref:Uncharacterized protein n=1 Tax=Coniella lustricola TaxID=2025994 RepID=A0A2T3A8B6_9PEZI|nr:hypothetical protein BD289DRAFT_252741 [Coniella lustricola]
MRLKMCVSSVSSVVVYRNTTSHQGRRFVKASHKQNLWPQLSYISTNLHIQYSGPLVNSRQPAPGLVQFNIYTRFVKQKGGPGYYYYYYHCYYYLLPLEFRNTHLLCSVPLIPSPPHWVGGRAAHPPTTQPSPAHSPGPPCWLHRSRPMLNKNTIYKYIDQNHMNPSVPGNLKLYI